MAVALLVAAQHRLDELEQLPDLVDILLPHLQHGRLTEAHVDGQRRRQVDLNLVDERLGEGQQVGRGVRRALDCADDRIGVEEDDHVGPHVVVLHVDRHGRLSGHHDDRREAVDRRRVIRRGVLVGRQRRDDQIIRKVEYIAHLLLDAGDGYLVQALAGTVPALACRAAVGHSVVGFSDKCKQLFGLRKYPRAKSSPHVQSRCVSHWMRSAPGRHSICSGNSAPGCPSTSVGSLHVEWMSIRRARSCRTIFGLPPSR